KSGWLGWSPWRANAIGCPARRKWSPRSCGGRRNRKSAPLRCACWRPFRTVEKVAEYLRDTSPEVRQAAQELLRWNAAERWPWIRNAFREALSQATLQ